VRCCLLVCSVSGVFKVVLDVLCVRLILVTNIVFIRYRHCIHVGVVVAAVMSRTFYVVEVESLNGSGVCSMHCDVETTA